MTDSSNGTASERAEWNWRGAVPIQFAPYFAWPPQPIGIIKTVLGRGFLGSLNSLYVVLAIVTWLFLAPPLADWATFEAGWIMHMFVLNLALIGLTAGGLHLYFHTYKRQGTKRKFDFRAISKRDTKFFANNQVLDNIFFTCVSGVTIWTAFQVVVMWAYANNIAPWLNFAEHPVWFVLMFLLLPMWGSLHFYVIHRLLHWRPLYKLAHALHHRNVDPNPWSGLSMHPIEHVLYLSFVFIHLVVPTHPIHLFFLAYTKLLSAITSHSGYEDLLVGDKRTVEFGEFFHQIHHRYFDCNYGTLVMPWDQWFGSFHDGSAEATQRVRALQRRKRASESKISSVTRA